MMDAAALQWQVKTIVEAQTLLYKEVVAKAQHNCERQREGARQERLSNFVVVGGSSQEAGFNAQAR